MEDELGSWNYLDPYTGNAWIIIMPIVITGCLLLLYSIVIKYRRKRLLDRAGRNAELTDMDVKPHLWTTDYVNK